MGVGHRIRCLHNAGQRSDVGSLLVDLVVHVTNQIFIGIDDRRHVHRAVRLNAPGRGVDTREAVRIHGWLF